MNNGPRFHAPSFSGKFGVARRDITPPLEIYARNWGAAPHDQARSIHRPLTLTVLTVQEQNGGEGPLVLVALDLGWWRSAEEEQILQGALREAGIGEGRGVLALSHTHSGPIFSPVQAGQPGGEHIENYLQTVCCQIREAVAEALGSAGAGIWESATGNCPLAHNRDLPDPDGTRYLVGWNPDAEADQTLIFGRISDAGGNCLATLVNYACHPTILAWENTAISPDFVGAMREVLENATGAPCLFLQGASGELAPRHQYVGDPNVADRAGYCLGHAALALFYDLPSPGCELVYDGSLESGAPLALWRERVRKEAAVHLGVRRRRLQLEIRKDLPSLNELEAELATCTERTLKERLQRKILVRRSVGGGASYALDILLWSVGEMLVVAVPSEVYSAMQKDVREWSHGRPVFFITLANGGRGYLAPETAYDEDLYAVWQSPFARGSWERCRQALEEELLLVPPDMVGA